METTSNSTPSASNGQSADSAVNADQSHLYSPRDEILWRMSQVSALMTYLISQGGLMEPARPVGWKIHAHVLRRARELCLQCLRLIDRLNGAIAQNAEVRQLLEEQAAVLELVISDLTSEENIAGEIADCVYSCVQDVASQVDGLISSSLQAFKTREPWEINDEMLAGANDYQQIVQQIYALEPLHVQPDPDIDSDDGERVDYQAADKIVDSMMRVAMSTPDRRIGFQRAMANAIFTDTFFQEFRLQDTEALLTHDGYRSLRGKPLEEAKPAKAGKATKVRAKATKAAAAIPA